MGTGGEAGTYYAFGGVLGSYIGSNTDISINVVASGGSAANITGIVKDGIYDLATVQSDVMTYAFNGTNSFTDNKMDGFRVLGGLYAETVQIVTVDPDIKSIPDLAGRNVCVGDVGSGTYFNTVCRSMSLIFTGAGWTNSSSFSTMASTCVTWMQSASRPTM